MKQSDFDSILLKGWKLHTKTGFLMTQFVEMHGYPKPETFEDAYKILKNNGIERIPNRSYWFGGVGVWLANAYPQFMEAVLRSGDASKIHLPWLKFIEPMRLKQCSAQRQEQYMKKRYAAVRLADTLHAIEVRGDYMHGHRSKSPIGKRKS